MKLNLTVSAKIVEDATHGFARHGLISWVLRARDVQFVFIKELSSVLNRGDCVVSLFSGAMGLDLGLEQAGLPTSLAVEVDELCCSTMRTNRPALDVWQTDINEVDGGSLLKRLGYPEDVFLMVGGPPCQSFCSGGKRAGLSDPRGNLIYVYLKILSEVRPQFFVLENVANIVTAALRHRPIAQRPGKHWNLSAYDQKKSGTDDDAPDMEPDELSGSAIRQIISDMLGLGFHLSFSVVDSADYAGHLGAYYRGRGRQDGLDHR